MQDVTSVTRSSGDSGLVLALEVDNDRTAVHAQPMTHDLRSGRGNRQSELDTSNAWYKWLNELVPGKIPCHDDLFVMSGS